MTRRSERLLPVAQILSRTPGPVRLSDLVDVAHLSAGRLQRVFSARFGESPAQYQQRIRLQRAAALLAGTDSRIIDIAVVSGFESHEAFTRAFRRRFGVTPSRYRERVHTPLSADGLRLAAATAPCVSMHGISMRGVSMHTIDSTTEVGETEVGETEMGEIERRRVDPTPTVHGVRRVPVEKVGEVLAEVLPDVFGYVMERGLEMSGPPYVRYLETSPAFVRLEAGMPLVKPIEDPIEREGILVGELPGGDVAVKVHKGPYDTLAETHAVLDRWADANGLVATGPAWEVYITDPAEVPDPAEWLTEVFWPVGPRTGEAP